MYNILIMNKFQLRLKRIVLLIFELLKLGVHSYYLSLYQYDKLLPGFKSLFQKTEKQKKNR